MLPFQDRSQEPKAVSITNSHAPDIPEPCPIQSYKQMHTKQNRFGHFLVVLLRNMLLYSKLSGESLMHRKTANSECIFQNTPSICSMESFLHFPIHRRSFC
ncbi:hypothetical protein CDAR_243921 [Caerostris darwini]|uniref:Uncharacterized protein n=1 Tax=Caerostris darwini TaxID=1538125 RepID=A0AAV4W6H4_9ARAC|nr:hypothetical protein CDAR_243921 [Caerostris darwini]